MKLSEAIRKGASMSLPGMVNLVMRDSEKNLYTCALGAAHIGSGGSPDMDDSAIYARLRLTWPELNSIIREEDSLENAIWHANDILEWTRERTASWLEEMGY